LRHALGWLERRFNLTEMFSFLSSFGLLPLPLDTSRPMGDAIRASLEQPMPSYARWPRVLGILSLMLFLFLAVTGVMLAFYYQPSPEEAYGSVTTIVRDVPFGWFVHQIHGWAAHALLLILLVRAWRFYFQGLYREPREGLWILAILLFFAATNSDFTGRLLAWDSGGYWSTIRALEIVWSLPLLGPLLRFLVGGTEPGNLLLIRFYFLHVVVLPGIILVLLYLNFSGVRRVGLSTTPGESRLGMASFRVHLYSLAILMLLIFGLLVTLSALVPAPYEDRADPFVTPPGARPPWYLLAAHGFLEVFPAGVPRWARALLLEGILLIALLWPFLDRARRPAAGWQTGWRAIFGAMVLMGWLAFSVYGWWLEGAP